MGDSDYYVVYCGFCNMVVDNVSKRASHLKFELKSQKDLTLSEDILKFDLAIFELRVADFFNDLEVVKKILAKRPLLPVMVLSKNDNLELKLIALRSGVTDFQSPDMDLEEIIARAESLARLGRSSRLVEVQNEILINSMQEIQSLEKERSNAQASLVHNSKMAPLGEMAGNLAHEINNPLAILNGRIVQMGKSINAETFSKQEANEILDKMASVSKRIASITKGLKSFSRSGEKDPFEEINMQALVDDTLSFCAEGIRQLSIELKILPVPPHLFVSGRPTQLSQVLLNLLSNARDAVETYPEKWISVEVVDSADQIILKVTDSGPGLPDHMIEKIYEPFFTTKPVNKGTGLGLSISKTILAEHGGVLTLDRECPNTCFMMVIPKVAKN